MNLRKLIKLKLLYSHKYFKFISNQIYEFQQQGLKMDQFYLFQVPNHSKQK